MAIFHTSTNIPLQILLRKLRNGLLSIPPHQREYIWTLSQQVYFIEAVLNGPIPSILLRDLEDDRLSLEDGLQRLTTLQRFVNNEFLVNGVLYKDMPAVDQDRLMRYNITATTYSGATDEEARRIFNAFQNGKPLTFGERIRSLQHTSPIIDFAIEHLFTESSDLYRRLQPVMALETRTPKAKRGADLTTAFALCAGLEFGVDHMSRKWGDAEKILHKTIDYQTLRQKLTTYAEIWEEVNRLAPVTSKARSKQYWDLGNFGGYIAYTISVHGTPEAEGLNLPETKEGLIEFWSQFIVRCYRDELLLPQTLHRTLSSARSWKLARWLNGIRSVFRPDIREVLEDSEDDESD
jgi:hypothetical protein